MRDANLYIRNKSAYPTEKLLQYVGKFVAWSEDGTTIIAAADTAEELFEVMDTRHPDVFFVIGYVPADWDGKHDRPFRPTPFPTEDELSGGVR